MGEGGGIPDGAGAGAAAVLLTFYVLMEILSAKQLVPGIIIKHESFELTVLGSGDDPKNIKPPITQ